MRERERESMREQWRERERDIHTFALDRERDLAGVRLNGFGLWLSEKGNTHPPTHTHTHRVVVLWVILGVHGVAGVCFGDVSRCCVVGCVTAVQGTLNNTRTVLKDDWLLLQRVVTRTERVVHRNQVEVLHEDVVLVVQQVLTP